MSVTDDSKTFTQDELDAAVTAERERIAMLADRCHVTYELSWQRASFADLIRSSASAPPWWGRMP